MPAWAEHQAGLLRRLAAGEPLLNLQTWPPARRRIDFTQLYAGAPYATRVRPDASGEPLPLPDACPSDWTR